MRERAPERICEGQQSSVHQFGMGCNSRGQGERFGAPESLSIDEMLRMLLRTSQVMRGLTRMGGSTAAPDIGIGGGSGDVKAQRTASIAAVPLELLDEPCVPLSLQRRQTAILSTCSPLPQLYDTQASTAILAPQDDAAQMAASPQHVHESPQRIASVIDSVRKRQLSSRVALKNRTSASYSLQDLNAHAGKPSTGTSDESPPVFRMAYTVPWNTMEPVRAMAHCPLGASISQNDSSDHGRIGVSDDVQPAESSSSITPTEVVKEPKAGQSSPSCNNGCSPSVEATRPNMEEHTDAWTQSAACAADAWTQCDDFAEDVSQPLGTPPTSN
jgi:hypothetical protein